MSDVGLRRVEATVHGMVQGVMYRGTTVKIAKQLNLQGWVKNNPNGTVSTVAEGSQEALREFIDYLHQGPATARVTQVDVQWREATGEFKRFTVLY